MRRIVSLALALATLLPLTAAAQETALALGPDGSGAVEIRELLARELLDRGHGLVSDDEVAETIGGSLTADPAPSTLEGWAEALQVDLLIAVFIDRSSRDATTLRVSVHLRRDHTTTTASREVADGPLADTALALVRNLLSLVEPHLGDDDDDTPEETAPIEEPSEPEALATEPVPPPPLADEEEEENEEDGRVQLILNSTLLGFSLMSGVLFAADVQDPRLFSPIFLVGGAGGLVTSLLIYRRWRVSRGDNAVVAAGGWYGAGLGVLMAGILGYDQLRWLMTGGLVGQVAGLAAGIVAAAFTEISSGDGAVIHSGAIWGLFLGGVAATLIWDSDPRTSYGLVLAGMLAGVGAGALTAHLVEISAGRTAVIDLCGFLGVLLGASIGTPIIVDSQNAGHMRAYAGILLGTAAIGIGIGALVTRNWDRPREGDGDEAASSSRGQVSFVPVPTVIPPAPSAPWAGLGLGVQLVGGTW